MALRAHINKLSLTLCLLLLSTASLGGQGYRAYKWVDEDGSVHFSQTPPPSSTTAEVIEIKPASAIKPVTSEFDAPKSVETETATPQTQPATDDQLTKQQQLFEENCKTARKNKQLYQDNPGHRFTDADGNVVRLTEEARQAKIQESQKQIDFYCK